MHIVVAGSTGLIGSALCRHLMDQGHRVRRLVRPGTLTAPNKAPSGTLVHYDPATGEVDMRGMQGADAVVNLAGEPILGWWSDEKKKRIMVSRVQTTQTLAKALSDMITPPRVLINASAVGYYGDRGDERLVEDSDSGSGFLSEVCRRWEASTQAADDDERIRVIHARFGNVLSPQGGMLAKMLPVFYLGLGGKLGSGEQWMPWITLPDVCGAVNFLIENDSARSGAYNVVAPNPVTNREFTKTLGKVVHRPTVAWVPGTILETVMGELGREALVSQRVIPQRLLDAGYQFQHPELEQGLRAILTD